MKKLIIYILLSLATVSQAQQKHYVSVKGNAGLSSLLYRPIDGESTFGFGGGAQVNYRSFFNDNMAFGFGLGISTIQASCVIDEYGYSTDQLLVDDEGDSYIAYHYLVDWEEEQSMLCLEVPIVFSYHSTSRSQLQFYIDAGLIIKFPLSSSYTVGGGVYEERGYYPDYDLMLHHVAGYYDEISDLQPSGEVNAKTSVGLTSSVGITYTINKSYTLFAGLTADYGINNIKPYNQHLLQQYNDAKWYAGVTNSSQIDKVVPIKLALEFGVAYKIKKKAKLFVW